MAPNRPSTGAMPCRNWFRNPRLRRPLVKVETPAFSSKALVSGFSPVMSISKIASGDAEKLRRALAEHRLAIGFPGFGCGKIQLDRDAVRVLHEKLGIAAVGQHDDVEVDMRAIKNRARAFGTGAVKRDVMEPTRLGHRAVGIGRALAGQMDGRQIV